MSTDDNTTEDLKARVFNFSAFGGDSPELEDWLGIIEVDKIYDSDQRTPAQVAVKYGNVDSFKVLVRHGANIDYADENGETLVMLALKNNKEDMTSYLVDVGANLNVKDEKNNETALHLAVKCCTNGKLIESIILAGADINSQNSEGNTCLHLACGQKNVAIACMLIHLGAMVGIKNNNEENCLHEACKNELFTVIDLMCSRDCQTINNPNKTGDTALHFSAKTGNMDIIRLLLLSGAEIDSFNMDGMMPENLAMSEGHKEAANLLSKLGSSIATDKLIPLREQINNKQLPIDSIKVKIFGGRQSGKSTLIDSMKCSFIWSFVKKFYSGLDLEETRKIKDELAWVEAPVESYTKGIDVHQVNISGIGKLSIWEFSSFEPYFAYYDFFVGDPSCIHIITFNILNDLTAIRDQLFFWLNFIRTRIIPHEPIGIGGTQLWSPHIVFVATHANDENSTKDEEGNFIMKGWEDLLLEIKSHFEQDLIVLPNLHVLNARDVNGSGMKALKMTIQKLKAYLTDYNGQSSGLMDAAVKELPAWIKGLKGKSPVVTWSNFINYIREKINPLILEMHVIDLVNQLQVIGEVVYLPTVFENHEDLIVLSPKWLATEILGRILSYETIQSSTINGQFTSEQLASLFPTVEFAELKMILQHLEFCLESKYPDEQILYHFPSLDFTTAPRNIWEGWNKNLNPRATQSEETELSSPLFSNEVWQGIRLEGLRHRGNYGEQMAIIYPRIALTLRKAISDDNIPVNVKRIKQWRDGMRIETEEFSTVVYLFQNNVNIVTRGRCGEEKSMFEFSEYCFEIIIYKIIQICPGFCVKRCAISATDIIKQSNHSSNENNFFLRIYDPKDVLETILNHEESISKTVIMEGASLQIESSEKIIDLLTFGNKEIFSLITLGTDIHISLLSIHARFALAQFLDSDNSLDISENNQEAYVVPKSENGWNELSDILQISNRQLNSTLDSHKKDEMKFMPVSQVDDILSAWSYQDDATIGKLAKTLEEIGRVDARNLLLELSPMFLRNEVLIQPKKDFS